MLVLIFLLDFMKLFIYLKEWERYYDILLSLQELMLKKVLNFIDNFFKFFEYFKWGICYIIDYLVDELKIFK